MEDNLNFKFGGNDFPLLVSVRSGSRASMPGMMDTVLNLGLNDITVNALALQAMMKDLLMIVIEDLFKCILI